MVDFACKLMLKTLALSLIELPRSIDQFELACAGGPMSTSPWSPSPPPAPAPAPASSRPNQPEDTSNRCENIQSIYCIMA